MRCPRNKWQEWPSVVSGGTFWISTICAVNMHQWLRDCCTTPKSSCRISSAVSTNTPRKFFHALPTPRSLLQRSVHIGLLDSQGVLLQTTFVVFLLFFFLRSFFHRIKKTHR